MGESKFTGKVFGKLVVLRDVGRNRPNSSQYFCECVCECGKFTTVNRHKLKSGKTTSCGCAAGRGSKMHGMTKTKIYYVWNGIRNRCAGNCSEITKKNYSSRGIKVCDEWNDFRSFYSWAMGNGYCEGLQIDRINNDLGYSPNNCRWVTPAENNKNKSNIIKVNVNGENIYWIDAARNNGISEGCARSRVYRGWSVMDAITVPLKQNRYV